MMFSVQFTTSHCFKKKKSFFFGGGSLFFFFKGEQDKSNLLQQQQQQRSEVSDDSILRCKGQDCGMGDEKRVLRRFFFLIFY